MRYVRISVLIFLLAGLAAGQQQPANPVDTQQITMPVFTLAPAPATGATIALGGNPGPQTIYYWISANYPVGKANLAGPFQILNAPSPLSPSAFVTINPTIPAGATSYDVLKTLTPVQPNGACACAVATAVAIGTVTNDQSDTTGAYTVTPTNINVLGMTLQNEVQGAGSSHLILRQNGAFVADLSLAGISATFGTLGGGTNNSSAMICGTGCTLTASGTGIIGATTTPFSGVLSGTNTTSAFVVGSLASLVPSGLGQITGITDWYSPGGAGIFAPQPTLTGALTGGSLGTGAYYIQVTINQGTNHSLPSLEEVFPLNAGSNCASGTSCTITVTAPALTGTQTYTVYSSNVSGSEKQQAASANCVNITGNCVIGAIGLGAAPPTTNTTGIAPANQATGECPSGVDPNDWMLDATGSTNYHTLTGIDRTTLWGLSGLYPVGQRGWLEYCRPVIFNRSGKQPYSGSPTATSMTANGSMFEFNEFSPTNVFGFQLQNNTPGTASGSWPTQLEGIYSEVNIFGSPVLGGGETNAGAIRGTMAIYGSPTLGGATLGQAVGGSFTTIREAGSTPGCSGVPCFVGAQGQAANLGSTSAGGWYIGLMGQASDNASSHDTNALGVALYAHLPTTGGFFPQESIGLYSDNFGNCGGVSAVCYDAFFKGSPSDATQGQVFAEGNVFVGGLKTASGAINTLGSFVNTGSYGTVQLGTPQVPTAIPIGAAGTTSWSYAISYLDGNGDLSPLSSSVTETTGNATLDGTNFNRVCTNASNLWATSGMSGIAVYRTSAGGTPSTTGLIGTFTPKTAISPVTIWNPSPICFADTGLAGDGSTGPTRNATGAVKTQKLETLSNCSAAGSAANPSIVACSSASSGAFSCDPTASTGSCTVNTTAVNANSDISITPSAADGTRLGVTCNTTADIPTGPRLAAKVAGVSFTINLGTVAVNPTCYEYTITN